MNIKETLLIFILGLFIGVGVSPYASGTPQDFFISPVSLSMAQTKDLLVPLAEGEVLGAMTEAKSPPPVTFENLQNLVDQEDNEPVKQDEENKNEISALALSEKNKRTNPVKGELTVAVLGDSMVDTMGPSLPYLEKALKNYYPEFHFHLLNYGAGGTNIDYGVQRLTQPYEYLGKTIPALVSTKPDIVIVESFAYNPWGAEKSDLDRHWLAMAKVIDILKSQTQAKILFLATIAPNKANFGAGPNGINWAKDQAWQHAEKINLYLENSVRFAQSQNIPVVDAYHPSLVAGDGNLAYINASDHIHPSVSGCQFIANLLAQKLNSLGWIK